MRTAIILILLTAACGGEAFETDLFPERVGDADPVQDSSPPPADAADASTDCELPFPDGTQINASLSKPIQPPELAVDGDLATAWNAGASSAQIWFTLPEPLALSAVSLHVTASPSSQAAYLVSALQGGVWSEVGRREAFLADRQVTLVEIDLPEQPYQVIRIDANIDPSHAAIYEIRLLGDCP